MKSVIPNSMPSLNYNSGQRVELSKCATKLALAMANPFAPEVRGVCLPVLPGCDTFKAHGFVRGDCVIGTAGFGFITVAPCLSNDAPCIFASTAAYSRTDVGFVTHIVNTTLGTLTPGVVQIPISSLPYPSSAFLQTFNDDGDTPALYGPPNIVGRMVSCGISLQYTGTLMNTSGMIYGYRAPTHLSATLRNNAPLNTTTISSFTETMLCAQQSGTKCMLRDYATDNVEQSFVTTDGPGGDAIALYPYCKNSFDQGCANGDSSYLLYNPPGVARSVTVGTATITYLFTGVPGSTMHYEYISHCEYIGTQPSALVTRNDIDPVGTQMVTAAATSLQARAIATPGRSGWDDMRDALSEIYTMAKPMVVPMIESAVKAALM